LVLAAECRSEQFSQHCLNKSGIAYRSPEKPKKGDVKRDHFGRQYCVVRGVVAAVSKNTPTIVVAAGALLREGIAVLLQNTPYKVVGAAAEPEELTHVRHSERGPILAIVGTNVRHGKLDEAAESVRLLRSLLPHGGKVVLIVETDATIDVPRLLASSIDGCIVNLGSRDTLIKTLELVFMNERIFAIQGSMKTVTESAATNTSDNDGPPRIVNEPDSNGFLSPRERQVLTSLAEGKSNKVIARQYGLSEATVKVHLKAVLRKTGKRNRTQAAIWAINHGLCEPVS
jgi:two-component system, NarL family, nitrate/nitrite response regulator NarL